MDGYLSTLNVDATKRCASYCHDDKEATRQTTATLAAYAPESVAGYPQQVEA